MKIDDFKPLWLRKWRIQRNINQLEWDLLSDLWSKKLDVETFLCQSRKKISFSKINLLNLRKNLVGPWGSTQLGERSPKPVSQPKSDTRKVSQPSSPQNRPTCTCSTLPRASARTPPLGIGVLHLWIYLHLHLRPVHWPPRRTNPNPQENIYISIECSWAAVKCNGPWIKSTPRRSVH